MSARQQQKEQELSDAGLFSQGGQAAIISAAGNRSVEGLWLQRRQLAGDRRILNKRYHDQAARPEAERDRSAEDALADCIDQSGFDLGENEDRIAAAPTTFNAVAALLMIRTHDYRDQDVPYWGDGGVVDMIAPVLAFMLDKLTGAVRDDAQLVVRAWEAATVEDLPFSYS